MIKLKEAAYYVSDKIDVSKLTRNQYITTDNMLPNRGGVTDCENLPQAARVTKYECGDILVSNIRPYFKKIWYANKVGGCSNDVIVFRANNDSLNSKFLYYVLSQNSFFDFVMSGANGTKMPRGNKDLIPDFLMPNFNTKKQKSIADILSAYDDLIENNQKQIKLLEEAAQRLYKEWFVDFRFPGYEDTKFIDGIPDGWRKEPICNIVSYEIGGGWGEDYLKEQNDRPAFVIRGTDLHGITHGDILSIPYRYHTQSNLASRILQDGDIVFEVSGGSKTEGVARTLLIRNELLEMYGSPVICASFCKLIRFVDNSLSQYMYNTLQYLRLSGKTSEFDKKSASSIVNYRWKDFLSQQDILIPSLTTIEAYNRLAEYYYQQIINSSKMIERLKNARDRLLPKLMSGEIEV